jgi:ribonuclease D
LQALKAAMVAISEEREIPAENVLQPDLMRRVAWEPMDDIAAQLRELGAREWQIELVAAAFTDALKDLN